MIKVLVSGAKGRMGQEVIRAVTAAPDMEVIAVVDPKADGETIAIPGAEGKPEGADSLIAFGDLFTALTTTKPDVAVDFSTPSAAEGNVRTILGAGVDCVLGTTGLSVEKLEELSSNLCGNASLFFAPNFTIGAVLMMEFAERAARYMPYAEIIEMHHLNKKDAPSGTAIQTARMISDAQWAHAEEDPETAAAVPLPPGRETEIEGFEGARGALGVKDVPIHSVRMSGFMASQEVIFGMDGQTLSIRHDSTERSAYMPGVLLAIRKVGSLHGLTIGLEKLMED